MTTNLEAELFCPACNQDCTHVITYVGDQISRIECALCHRRVEISRHELVKRYAADFLERVLTKPQRMTKEFEMDLRRFLRSLPGRVVTKPRRIAREIRDVISKE